MRPLAKSFSGDGLPQKNFGYVQIPCKTVLDTSEEAVTRGAVFPSKIKVIQDQWQSWQLSIF